MTCLKEYKTSKGCKARVELLIQHEGSKLEYIHKARRRESCEECNNSSRFLDRTASVNLRKNSSPSKLVSVDWAVEDANYRVKHGTFQRGLPTQERISKFILVNDRVSGELISKGFIVLRTRCVF